jgi:hypothetical protein
MKSPTLWAGAQVQKRTIPTIAAGPFSDVQILSFSELDVLTPAPPVRANPARASCSPCPPRYSREIILTLTAYEQAICASVSPLPRRAAASLRWKSESLGLRLAERKAPASMGVPTGAKLRSNFQTPYSRRILSGSHPLILGRQNGTKTALLRLVCQYGARGYSNAA